MSLFVVTFGLFVRLCDNNIKQRSWVNRRESRNKLSCHTHPPVGPGRSPRCGWRTARRAGLWTAAASARLCSLRCPAAVEAPQSSLRRPLVTSGCSWPDDLELTSETSQSLSCFCSPNTWRAPWGEEGGKGFTHVKKLNRFLSHLDAENEQLTYTFSSPRHIMVQYLLCVSSVLACGGLH